jgi:molybdopterin molybdotransferase
VGPAIARLQGLAGTAPRAVPAILGADLAANDHRADHLRATLTTDQTGRLVATAFARQDSGMLRTLAQADALILRPPHAPAACAGDLIEILPLDGLG